MTRRSRRLSEQSYDVGLRAYGGDFRHDNLHGRNEKWLNAQIDRAQFTLDEWRLQRDALIAFTSMARSDTMCRAIQKCDLHIQVYEMRLERLRDRLVKGDRGSNQRPKNRLRNPLVIEHQPPAIECD